MACGDWSKFVAPDYINTREIFSPDLIRPWVMVGPFKVDVSKEVDGATLFEQPGRTDNGQERYDRAVEEVEEILKTAPSEGDGVTCFGLTETWHLLRVEEPMPHWGSYNNRNHLSATFLSTRITPQMAGTFRFRARQHIYNQVFIAVNGEIQAQSPKWDLPDPRWNDQHFEFSLHLPEGESVITVAVVRLARVVIGGLMIEALDGAFTVRPPLCDLPIKRDALEHALMAVRVPRDGYVLGEDIRLIVDAGLDDTISLRVRLVQKDMALCEQAVSSSVGEVVLGKAEQGGVCTLHVDFMHHDTLLNTQDYALRISKPTSVLLGQGNYKARCDAALAYLSEGNEIWAQVARYRLGQYDKIDLEAIRQSCAHVRGRFDCADFQTIPLLRLMFMDRNQEVLPFEVRALIRETLLGFKYWVDEPSNDTMVTGTENHRMAFHVSEYLAGIFYPTDVFPNSGLTGLQHVAKARPYLMEWLAQRGRYGFNEWHSNVYYPVSLMPVLALLDWAPGSESPLKMQAQQVATMMCFTLAADTFEGVFGTIHGRTGASAVIHPETENTAGLVWLLTGEGVLNHNMGTASLAVSHYRPPKVVFDVADDRSGVMVSRQRHGLAGGEGSANFIVSKTPDYMLSALQDHSAGELTRQVHVFQVTMKERTVLFFTAPNTTSEEGGLRPNYWSGNSTTPRVFGEKNVAILHYQNDEITWMTHLFFERDRFDEVVEKAGWLFAKKEDGYVAVWSENGYGVGRLGAYAGRELICRARENAWIVECGRKKDNGSFGEFMNAIVATKPHRKDGQLVYASPSVGEIVFGWTGPATVNGNARALSGYPLVDSPFAQSAFGSGEMVLKHGDGVEELFFNQS
jgi:hypothetical protein